MLTRTNIELIEHPTYRCSDIDFTSKNLTQKENFALHTNITAFILQSKKAEK